MPVTTRKLQQAAARPYRVGQIRAKAQLKEALATKDGAARARRLRQVFSSNLVDRADPEAHRLLLQASRQLQQLSLAQQKELLPGSSAGKLLQLEPSDRGMAEKDGGFGWIRKANEESHRAARRQISALTRQAIDGRGYVIGSTRIHLRLVDAMLDGTRLVSPSLGRMGTWTKGGRGWTANTKLSVTRGTVLDVAVSQARAGRTSIAVNAASAYHAGGGFLSGGRHALEEAMCVQSSLFASLEKGVQLAEAAGVAVASWVRPARRAQDGAEWLAHLPDDGALLSPQVEVFRRGTNDGYPFEDEPVRLEAVVSVAMPNCNERMSDSPVDAQPEDADYMAQLEHKWRAVLTAAAYYTKATCLVVPDAGCGVFRNPPGKVGRALGQILRSEFVGRFEDVIIAFPGGDAGEQFAAAATAAFEGSADETKSAPTAVWEFGVQGGYKPFDDNCQAPLEVQFAAFYAGTGPAQGKVVSRGNTIIVDFQQMTQHVEGSDRIRDVRRRSLT
mmetsp:Transcript_920/g.1821  ORF Transcript_920/g.1821 Transcript_920/m.1821 type:complete len:502 (-) Transcript_920:26-1531(-)